MSSFDQNLEPPPPPESFPPPIEPAPDDSSTRNKVIILLVAIVVVVVATVFVAKRMLAHKPIVQIEAPKTVVVGDTRDRVLQVLGKPMGSTKKDSSEVLIYANGRVALMNNKVTEVDILEAGAMGEIRKADGRKVIIMDGGRIQMKGK